MERAIVEEWVSPPPKGEEGPDVWKSSGHRDLVLLCDDHCYADMTSDGYESHKSAIIALCDKIGWTKDSQQGTVHQVPQPAQTPSVVSESGQGQGLG